MDSLVRMFPLQFEEDGSLLFREEEGLESDSFKKDEKYEEAQILRNIDNHVLMAYPTDHADAARFEDINNLAMQKARGIRFNIHIYKDTFPRFPPVAFSTHWDDTTYHMYVERSGDDMKVKFKTGNVPTEINDVRSEILFFKREFSRRSPYYKFESTLEKDHFLAFEKDRNNISRLIVKKTNATVNVDETLKMRLAAS